MENFQSFEKIENLNPSSNVLSHENCCLLCKVEVDDKDKKCENLNEKMICCIKIGTHPNSTSSSWKKK